MDCPETLRIALFGTSADPPHRGHAAILAWLATQFDHVAVWTANNPFKAHQTDLGDRFRMLELLIDELNTDERDVPPRRVQVHPELSHLRTVVTLERARQIWPTAQFSLVIGADLVEQLPTWHRADEIFAAVNILVIPRPGYDLTEARLASLRQRTTVAVAAMPAIDVSSSRYRQCDDGASSSSAPNLTPAVQSYIAQHHLYPCPQNSTEPLTTP
ncbi:nicotinate-nucleotide adenylyltransferase [Nodosilinea sp. LEGE 06152]|uniref:nicotinate-nucleotide adenylyltransferase n=1 Tax=Nodosilinea sp. LEGE 06152 TaxID=2777966 RepID=UPI0018826E3D|nr:nicotinate-nucleotide adenylyltransferase [Nodosilinea sp. LEGE 06152]MBE9158354.1 nicotinate-nucleotide adenylyltransferase [Nodosilinea sp. LEGE 06152]